MIPITTVWLCLITHVAYGTTIIINNNGSDSVECCVEGNCSCSSLSFALKYLRNNALITINSELVTLYDIVEMGAGTDLNNIEISGNGATIMCNSTGGVYCNSCSNITIREITWHQCGCKNSLYLGTETPALNFTTVSNMVIQKCIFLNSSGCPVYINYARESITIKNLFYK